MGLDLLVSQKPRAEFEDRFWPVWCAAMSDDGKRSSNADTEKKQSFFSGLFNKKTERLVGEERNNWLMQVSVPAYKLLGAPVVGQDEAADNWVRQVFADNALQSLEAMAGYHVLQLLPECDGIPVYTHGGMGYVDRTSFRGEFLKDCAEVLDANDIASAWLAMTPGELLDWGETLCRSALRFAQVQGVEYVIGRRNAPDEFGSAQSYAHIADSCGRWAIWWAKRGHGMDPYF